MTRVERAEGLDVERLRRELTIDHTKLLRGHPDPSCSACQLLGLARPSDERVPGDDRMKVRVDGMVIEVDGETCRCGAGCRVPLEGKPDHGDWPHMFWHVADDGWLERPHRHDPETDRRIPGPFPKFVVPSDERVPESEEPR